MLRKEPQSIISRGCFFSSDWRSTSEELSQGAVITGTPLSNINKGRFIGNGSSYITYPSSVKSKIDGATALSIIMQDLTIPTVPSNDMILGTWNGAGMMVVFWSATLMGLYFSVGGYARITVAGNQKMKSFAIVYDASLADASKIKIYSNGSIQTLEINTCTATSIPVGNAAFRIGAQSGPARIFSAGGSFGKVSLFNVALSAQEILDFANNSTFMSISGK